ncbi:LysR family transcriptional regulator [Bradyrhizobium sp. WD16]|nr:LysR family transcriptional regulator [Bradyrhizobium sp. WD16]UTD26117.1 LysR family transcriptional regulator [Bradyrhizobium sp. WD16]
MEPKQPTLDQLQIFLAIVETGSFAAAARRLGRATSVISYAIANLEAQLGLELFDRGAARTPQLTEAGRAVLADARSIALGVGELLAKARGLGAGLEAEVALVVDVMLPASSFVAAVEAFQTEFPTVSLRLYVEGLGAATQLVLDGSADIGITGPVSHHVDELEVRQLGAIRLVPVAAPHHPLAQIEKVTLAAARKHIQLVLADRSELTRGQDFGVIALRSWRLADLGAKHALLLAGIGWGSMPEAMVDDDLAAGRLKRLGLDAWDNVAYPLQAVHRSDRALGPAARWLLERLTGNCRRAEAKWTPVRVTQTPQKPKPPLRARRSGNGG